MRDPRMTRLAHSLVNYSCSVQPGERVLIENTGVQREMVVALIEAVYAAGGIPLVTLKEPQVQRALLRGCTQEQLELMAKYDSLRMRDCQAYIGLRSGDNAYATADVPAEKNALYGKFYGQKVHSQIRVPDTKWVVLRYPAPAMAQQAHMSTEAFEDFYFDVCCLDYEKMSRAMDQLVARMERTDRVHITGRGTDLTFSIKGQPAIKCDGKLNIPDGEVFSAPLRESVNGTLTYNTQSLYQGNVHENVSFVFENGKIVKATASNSALVNQILDTDEGARYIGEFAIGVNPYITRAMCDTLFDEKISASFHFTPGNCYDNCPNGNKSAIHWDLVCIQSPELGGGEIWFDDELIRKDGLFVPDSLHCLNPDALR